MKSLCKAAVAALALTAIPAQAAITLSGSLGVPGAMTDLSGISAAQGGNRLSFGSDLTYDRAMDVFYGITDRGPGGGVIGFAPRIEVFKLNTDANGGPTGFALQDTIVFKQNGVAFNGLNPQLLNGNPGVLGMSFDSEGIAREANGNFLVSDEYGPSVYEFSPTGDYIRSFATPANLLPTKANGNVDLVTGRVSGSNPDGITGGRQDNRGFEGLTLSPDGTKAYAILQDPLVNEGDQGDGRRSRNVRIVEFDVATGAAQRQFIYRLENKDDINGRIPGTADDFSATDQGRSIGASSIVALADGTFLVLERDNRGLGVDDPTGLKPIGSKRLYRISLAGATDVSGISLAGSSSLPAGVTAVSKALYLDIQAALSAQGLDPVEKLEGVAFGKELNGALSLFVVSDNDFSVTQTGAFGQQTDVCTSGDGGTASQVAIGGACPAGQSLIPSMIYGFRVSGADAVGVLPEPGTWAMMITGFGLVGGAMRRRRVLALA